MTKDKLSVLILTHNFPPDLGAASFRMESLVNTLIDSGIQTTVVTGLPNRYRGVGSNAQVYEKNGLLTIARVKSSTQNNNFIFRTFVYIQYFILSILRAISFIRKTDLIIATTPQLLTAFSGALLSAIFKKKFILDVRDLWPDTMLDLGLATSVNIAYKILKKIELFCYKKADVVVYNSPGFNEYLKNYFSGDMHYIPNGVDDSFYDTCFDSKRSEKNGDVPLKVVYAGNVGIAQDLLILTKVADMLKNDFEFHIYGDGSQLPLLREEIKKNSILNIHIHPPVERSLIPDIYGKADILFVHLKNVPMFTRTIPSKIYEYMCISKCIVYGLKGVSYELLESQKAGFSFPPNDPDGLKQALIHAKKSLKSGPWQGVSKAYIEKNLLRSTISTKYKDLISRVI
jgi:glycosyltransferase involved in cell wall biosynthesis